MINYKEILKSITLKDVVIVCLVPTVITIGYYGLKAYKAHKKKSEDRSQKLEDGSEKTEVGSEKLEDKKEETKVIPITKGQEVKENLEIDNTKWVKTN